jgi:hypothetical protein
LDAPIVPSTASNWPFFTLSPTFTSSFASRWDAGKFRFVVVAAANAPFAEASFDTDPSVTSPIHDAGVATIGYDGTACVTTLVARAFGNKVFITIAAPTSAAPNDTTAVRVTTRLDLIMPPTPAF